MSSYEYNIQRMSKTGITIYNFVSGDEQPTKPSTSLQLTGDTSTPIGVYAVSAPDEGRWPVQSTSPDSHFITFLIQVEEVEQAETFYIVKVGFILMYKENLWGEGHSGFGSLYRFNKLLHRFLRIDIVKY